MNKSDLWKLVDNMRSSVESSEYKHIVLGLLFLKHISNISEKFDISQSDTWQNLLDHSDLSDIAHRIDISLAGIELMNTDLIGATPIGRYESIGLGPSILGPMMAKINELPDDSAYVGEVYEYFLGQFAANEGKRGGEFFTPKCIVNLLIDILNPSDGDTIYDPTSGTCGMFTSSSRNVSGIRYYGQEMNPATWRLGKMNAVINDIHVSMGSGPANTLTDDQHPDLLADVIMANPPFNVKGWRERDEMLDDPRWEGYEVPPPGNANYAWLLHIVSKMKSDGIAGIVLTNSSVSGLSIQKRIREQIVRNNLVDAIIRLPGKLFTNTQIPCSVWILRKGRETSDTLMIDGNAIERESIDRSQDTITDNGIDRIADTYHRWRSNNGYDDENGFCMSANPSQIIEQDYTLNPGQYVGIQSLGDGKTQGEFEEDMRRLTRDYYSLTDQVKKIVEIMEHNLAEMGYSRDAVGVA